jgi:diguanylate cyclase (GGDEF)-like protein
VDEAHTVVLLVILISIGNILIHKRHWDIFIKENKIKEINEKLVEISQVDDLTGLFNRRKILDELEKTIDVARQYSSDFCVVMMDLDNFKRVNDKLGHIEGDKALCEFADVVKSNLRKNDILGRWGGEEFIILIPGSKKEDAFKFVERIRRKVEEHSFDKIGRLTFSVGICEFNPEYSDDKLIGNADFALYLSKQLGRNKVSIYAKAS